MCSFEKGGPKPVEAGHESFMMWFVDALVLLCFPKGRCSIEVQTVVGCIAHIGLLGSASSFDYVADPYKGSERGRLGKINLGLACKLIQRGTTTQRMWWPGKQTEHISSV